MDQTRELACTAVACRQGDIYPLYSDFDGFDWGGVKGELGRYSDQVRDDLTRSIRNGVKRACDMARDDRRMQITFVAIVGAVAFLSIPKHRRGRADTRPPSEFDAMQAMRTRQTQAKLDAMYKRMYAKEGTQGVLPRTASSKSEGPSKRKGRRLNGKEPTPRRNSPLGWDGTIGYAGPPSPRRNSALARGTTAGKRRGISAV